MMEQPVVEEPATEQPLLEELATEQPSLGESTVEPPVARKMLNETPTIRLPPPEKLTVKHPLAENTVMGPAMMMTELASGRPPTAAEPKARRTGIQAEGRRPDQMPASNRWASTDDGRAGPGATPWTTMCARRRDAGGRRLG